MGQKQGKGSSYEREICKQLSLWWTEGERDDVFWRCSGSGARATVRSRDGKDTAGQYGDVAATDPIGAPLIKAFTIEIKRGYSKHTIQDLVDHNTTSVIQQYEKFFAQAVENCERANSYAWLLITRRDRRQALVWMPYYCIAELRRDGVFSHGYPDPFLRISTTVRSSSSVCPDTEICCTVLEELLFNMHPENVKAFAKRV